VEFIRSGADVFRINSSHTDLEALALYVRLVRDAATTCGTHVGVLLDLQGPRIRLGTFRNGSVVLTQGASLRITSEEVRGSDEQVSTTYKDFAKGRPAGRPGVAGRRYG
jgi:pyruvate kinase